MSLHIHRAHKLAPHRVGGEGTSSLDNLAGRPRASGHFWETVALWSVLGMVATGASMIGIAPVIAAPAFVAFGAVAAFSNWRADVAHSSACERRWRAAREPSE